MAEPIRASKRQEAGPIANGKDRDAGKGASLENHRLEIARYMADSYQPTVLNKATISQQTEACT